MQSSTDSESRSGVRSPPRVAGDYLILSAGEFVAKLAGFVAFAYLARRLGPPAYGLVELAAALAMMFSLLVDFGLGPIGAREVARHRESAAELAAGIPAARLVLALIGGLGMLGCALLLEIPAAARLLVILYACSLLLAPWNLNWLFQGLDLMRLVAPAQVLRMAVFAVGAIVLVSDPQDAWRVGIAETAAAATMAGYFVFLRRKYVPLTSPRPKLGALPSLLSEALPVGMSRVLWALNQYLPTVFVAFVMGGSALAWFGAAHRVATSAGSFVFLYHFNLYPRVVQAMEGRPRELEVVFETSFRSAAWLGTLAALGGTLLSVPVCRLIYGAEFEIAATTLAVLVWLIPLSLMGTHARFALIACGRQKKELAANAAGLAVLLLVSLQAVSRWGPVGAAVAMLLSSTAAWWSAHLLAKPHVEHLPFARPLVRPLAAAGLAAAVVLALKGAGSWISIGAGLGLFMLTALVIEPRVKTDLTALLSRRSTSTAGDRE